MEKEGEKRLNIFGDPMEKAFYWEFKEKQRLEVEYASKVYMAKMRKIVFKMYYWK